MILRKETIGPCELYLADCKDVLNEIQNVDAFVIDPPYGVMLGQVRNGQARTKNQIAYTKFSDSPQYIADCVVPSIKTIIDKSKRGAVTCGNRNMFLYPQPADFGVWYNPGSSSRGKWGFSLVVTPILYYGKDPRAGRGMTASSVWGKNDSSTADIKNISHPCPKPLTFIKWLVNKVSLEGETVMDSFMGTGTTGVACIQIGRRFIGIEIEPNYFDVACKRIEEAHRQADMFNFKPKPTGR